MRSGPRRRPSGCDPVEFAQHHLGLRGPVAVADAEQAVAGLAEHVCTLAFGGEQRSTRLQQQRRPLGVAFGPQHECPLIGAVSGRVVIEGHRSVTRLAQRPPGPIDQLGALGSEPAGLVGVSQTCGLRRVSSHLWQQPLIGLLLKRSRDQPMQLHFASHRDLVVPGVAEQPVDECEAAGPTGLTGNETCQLGPLERIDHRRQGAGAGGREQIGVEFGPGHCRQVEHGKIVLVDQGVAAGEQRPQRSHGARGPADGLSDEQWIAAGLSLHRCRVAAAAQASISAATSGSLRPARSIGSTAGSRRRSARNRARLASRSGGPTRVVTTTNTGACPLTRARWRTAPRVVLVAHCTSSMTSSRGACPRPDEVAVQPREQLGLGRGGIEDDVGAEPGPARPTRDQPRQPSAEPAARRRVSAIDRIAMSALIAWTNGS